MFATRILFRSAKDVLSTVWDKRPFHYSEVNLSNNEPWRNLYDFDIPVIHFAKADSPEEDVTKHAKALKLMHRFTPEEVEAKMDQIDGK